MHWTLDIGHSNHPSYKSTDCDLEMFIPPFSPYFKNYFPVIGNNGVLHPELTYSYTKKGHNQGAAFEKKTTESGSR